MTPGHDVKIVEWSSIENDFAGDGQTGAGGLLLLGNGFSTNIWSAFDYPSLLTRSNLGGIALQLFGDRANFETVLAELSITLKVLKVAGTPSQAAQSTLLSLQTEVRDALLVAVGAVHPDASELVAQTAASPAPLHPRILTTLATYLKRHAEVFVTNYDLIAYWAAVEGNIADLFPGSAPFDERKATAWLRTEPTKILFLHGALHLWRSLSTNEAGKQTAGPTTRLLDEIRSTLNDPDRVPLFISEGRSDEKLSRIRSSPYLSFCNRALAAATAPLTVLGHSFNNVDLHIREAIQIHPARKIAVGIWTGGSESLPTAATRIRGLLAKCTDVVFFDSTDHPLTSPGLHCK